MARQRFSSISRRGGSSNGRPSSIVARGLGDAGDDQRRQAPRTPRRWTGRRRCGPRPCRRSRCGRIDHHTCVYSTIEFVRIEEVDVVGERLPAAEGVGHPAAREHAGEALGAGGVQAASRARRGTASWPRSPAAVAAPGAAGRTRARRGRRRARRRGRAATRVVAPRDVAELLVQPAVVLGVDDVLLAVVGPRVGAGRAERDALLGGQREQPPAAVALAGQRRRRSPRRGPSGSRSPRRSARPRSSRPAPDRPRRRRAGPRSAARGRASSGRGSRTPPRGRR